MLYTIIYMDNTPLNTEESSSKKNVLCEVTSLSKIFAAVIFITLPFVGGWIGYIYAPVQVIEVEKIVIRDQAPATPNHTEAATEQYFGVINNDSIVFAHNDYTSYTLLKNGTLSQGELNTERGFEDDIDATVYILNWREPESEQVSFVRLTKDTTHVLQLDSHRKIMQGAVLEKAQPTVVFKCANTSYIQASFSENYVRLLLNDEREFVLPQVISGSGARYANSDESFVFWNKGNTSFIDENGIITFTDCATEQ